jgi:hypothetical protein
MPRNLTHADLIKAGACNKDADLFLAKFGEGNEVTIERVMAVAQDFDWLTGAKLLLTPRQARHFHTLVRAAFRGVKRVDDPKGEYRRKALAKSFCLAYNSKAE